MFNGMLYNWLEPFTFWSTRICSDDLGSRVTMTGLESGLSLLRPGTESYLRNTPDSRITISILNM